MEEAEIIPDIVVAFLKLLIKIQKFVSKASSFISAKIIMLNNNVWVEAVCSFATRIESFFTEWFFFILVAIHRIA